MATAGYWILFMQEWIGKEEEMMPYRDAMFACWDKHGGEKVFVGPAAKQYEMGNGRKPNMAVVKFESKDKAVAAYADIPDKTNKVVRDLRIIEAPADLFLKGKAYWVAQIEQVVDQDKWNKYFAGFMAANGGDGFAIKYDDGTEKQEVLALKFFGGSEFKDDAKVGTGNFFAPEVPDNTGLVVIGELSCHEVGLKIKECPDYKKVLLSSLDLDYTTEEAYAEAEKRICNETVKRDVRICCLAAE